MFIADFHIHSKYSRATSKDMDLENLDKWAKIKGIKVLGTGDFTHPEWFLNLKEKLEPLGNGLFKLKDKFRLENDNKPEVFFILTVEISCIYSKNGKVRKIHIMVFSPSFEICEKINARLGEIGNLKSDGRPILGLDAKELAKIVLDISPDCLVVPAHCWTPWFSIFGSKSGFDSIEECFEEYSKYIYAVETGLSSDPAMNWRLSALDKITLISNSDAHSPQKIGREANVFETELSYKGIMEAIKTKNPKKFLYTIEFFPEEGKYHYDGHRSCGKSFSPKETKKYNNLCPVCKKPLTIGVLNRVEELADRSEGVKSANSVPFKANSVPFNSVPFNKANKANSVPFIPFKSLIPLQEIIAGALGVKSPTKKVKETYYNLINKFGSEFEILLNAPISDLESFEEPRIAEGVKLVREGKVQVEPGYDGVYGKVKIFSRNKSKELEKQKELF